MMVGRLLSYSEGNFSGAMLNFGRVSLSQKTSSWNLCSYVTLESNQKEEKTIKQHIFSSDGILGVFCNGVFFGFRGFVVFLDGVFVSGRS